MQLKYPVFSTLKMCTLSLFLLDKQQAGFENSPLYKVEFDQKCLRTAALEKDAAVFLFKCLEFKKKKSHLNLKSVWGHCLCCSVFKMRLKSVLLKRALQQSCPLRFIKS